MRGPPRPLRAPLASIPLPERLFAHRAEWRSITADPAILELVDKGLKLEFGMPAAVRRLSPVFRGTLEHKQSLIATIAEWLSEGAIEEVRPSADQCLSLLFPVVKKGNAFRWCLDARYLNSHFQVEPVKMSGQRELRNLLPKGAFFATIDLDKAYLHVPIRRGDRRWLAFQALGRRFRFLTMIFGLNFAPATFTRLLRPVLAELHRLGVHCSIYLDDIIIWDSSFERCERAVQIALSLLERLGLCISEKKCRLVPSQVAEYLGLLWRSRSMSVALPDDKLDSIRRGARHAVTASDAGTLTVRGLARLAGRITAARPAMAAACFRRHAIQRCVEYGLRAAGGPLNRAAWDARVTISFTARRDLTWRARAIGKRRRASCSASSTSSIRWRQARHSTS
jgi:Reverse transcriptase (RNA-dependent DNA polymerase)